MPTATDLVTDLPADFEVFGQAVATSMADLLGGTSGQILAKNSNTDMDFVWVANDVGDITAVTAGTGISGGGTSGAVTITNSMATEITAKGDLIAGTGSATFDNLPVGTNGQTLVADSTASTGLKWATPASSGSMTLISSTALSGASVSFTSITGTYKNLYIHLSNPYSSTTSSYSMTFNNDTTSTNYFYLYAEPGSASLYPTSYPSWPFQQGNWGFQSASANANSNGNAYHGWVYDYAGGTKKVFNGIGYVLNNNATDKQLVPTYNGVYFSNTAITRLDIKTNSGTWSGGTAYLYGVN
jgi:hypothetical protein